ncbi:pre-mrna-splicing factor slu7 [Gossypium australe]|uniref:Pre-mrna-splicing factor slu7 n=1 Tax=Gossypium australe TaxID=47621 RepID=A0A5B6VU32_9ROSI|nr:pre-mrna-splicing factor slu7 [Gossypium australe]
MDSEIREHEFATLVEKGNITEGVKRAERQHCEKGKNKRELEPLNSVMRPKKKARSDRPVRVGPHVALTGWRFVGTVVDVIRASVGGRLRHV